MAFPAHVDKDLMATVLAIAGFSEEFIRQQLKRSDDPNQVWGALTGSVIGRTLTPQQRTALAHAEKYLTSLSGNDLKDLLVRGRGLPEDAVSRAISSSKSTDTIATVLQRVGGEAITGILSTAQGLGTTGINKSKQQITTPPPPQPGSPSFVGPVKTPTPGDPNFIGPVKTPTPGDPNFIGPVKHPTGGISMEVPKDRAGVMNLQRLLNGRGANLKVDGVYGPATRAAHQQYGTGTVTNPAPGPAETLGSILPGMPPGTTPTVMPGNAAVPTRLETEWSKVNPANDAEVEAFIRREFGFAAWALDVPEIRQVLIDFTERMRGQAFSEAQLEAELLGTEWWKQKTETQRARVEQRHSDPATYNHGILNEKGSLQQLITQAGTGFAVSDARLLEIARLSYEQGWSEFDKRAALAAEFDFNPETGGQAASAVVGRLRSLATSYLVPLSEATIDEWGKALIGGTASEETITGYLREQAKQLMPSFAAQIESGLTPLSLVEPYKQTIAKEMGMDPNTLDLLDPKWNRFINNPDPKTGPRPMSFFEIQQTIRTDDTYRWDETDVAQREATEFATQMAQRFGRAG